MDRDPEHGWHSGAFGGASPLSSVDGAFPPCMSTLTAIGKSGAGKLACRIVATVGDWGLAVCPSFPSFPSKIGLPIRSTNWNKEQATSTETRHQTHTRPGRAPPLLPFSTCSHVRPVGRRRHKTGRTDECPALSSAFRSPQTPDPLQQRLPSIILLNTVVTS